MHLTPDHMFKAVAGVHARARGGYAVVSLILDYGVLAFRDPYGIRPLVLGERETAAGKEYAVASESVALDILGFKRLRDVAPGEAVLLTRTGNCSRAIARTAIRTRRAFLNMYTWRVRIR